VNTKSFLASSVVQPAKPLSSYSSSDELALTAKECFTRRISRGQIRRCLVVHAMLGKRCAGARVASEHIHRVHTPDAPTSTRWACLSTQGLDRAAFLYDYNLRR